MNLNLDIGTLIVTLILGHLLSGILGIFYLVKHKKDIMIYPYLLARLFDMLGWTLIGLRNVIDSFMSISIGNSLLIIGATLQIIAYLRIENRYSPIAKRFYIISTIVSICIFNLVTLLYAEIIRVSAISAILAVLCSFPVYVLLTNKNSSVIQRVIAILYGIEFIVFIIRACVGIKLDDSLHLMSQSIYNVMSFISLYLIMLIGNVGFVLIAKEKSDFELLRAATYDELTNIFNRRTFLLHAKESISQYSRKEEPVSFLLIDLDHFKQINDVHGHIAGDRVLKDFAANIKRHLRENDLFGRFGGEEFTVLLPGTNDQEALLVAERLRKATEDAFVSESENHPIKYTISIGVVTVIPDESTSINTLYKLSDEALYMAKEGGRNRIEVYKQHYI